MRFTKIQTQNIRREMTEAMQKVADKYNAKVQIGSIQYGDTISAKFTMGFVTSNEHGEYTQSKEALEFLRRAERLGLKKDVLNEKCKHRGDVYVVTGYNTRAPKYPITFTKNGKAFKASVDYMKDFVRSERPELFL